MEAEELTVLSWREAVQKRRILESDCGRKYEGKKNEENGCYSQAWTSAEGAEWSETLESFEP